MKVSIALGLCFGDEGKGLTTSSLASGPDSLVIRFNGGHQAGHTVIKGDMRHVFSTFGSGTINGASTYWSEFCTLYPTAFFNEREALVAKGFNPKIRVHPLAPVTTPWDVKANQRDEEVKGHGSCGVGFGATIERHENTPHKLFFSDLLYKPLLERKIGNIKRYHRKTITEEHEQKFLDDCEYAVRHAEIAPLDTWYINKFENIVFEGAQGIMLDMDHGFFPHVTRSNTTSKNAFHIIKENKMPVPDVFYVMRSYLTRHGTGFMPYEGRAFLKNNELETNVFNDWQGKFRIGMHCKQMLNFAMLTDIGYGERGANNLVITCLDQTDDKILCYHKTRTTQDIQEDLKIEINNIFTSHDGKTLQKVINEQIRR